MTIIFESSVEWDITLYVIVNEWGKIIQVTCNAEVDKIHLKESELSEITLLLYNQKKTFMTAKS